MFDIRNAGISQRHGFPQNGVTDERTQRASNHHLYTLAQELFEISDQAPWKPRRGIAGDIDQEVHIAFRRVFPTSHRAKKQDIARAVVGSQPQDFVSMFSYPLTGHSSLIVPSAQRL